MVESEPYHIERLLLRVPGVVSYSREKQFEVKPGTFIPIFINMKSALKESSVRAQMSKELVDIIGNEFDYICGVESGGSYYASGVADLMQKPLLFFRTQGKDYGNKKSLVGGVPDRGSSIAIVDDVFGTGATVSPIVKYFESIGCRSKLFVVFTYGFDEELVERLGTDGSSLATFEHLCKAGQEEGKFSVDDVRFLQDFLKDYKANFIRTGLK